MSTSSKFIKLHQNVLLEWVYDQDNFKQEDYQVIQDLITDKRGYMSKTGENIITNTIFPLDPVIKKYAKIDTSKYNYLKLENHSTPHVQFDKLRLHLPTSFSFGENGYIGLHVRIYTYDYNNKKVVDLSSYLFDDTVALTRTSLTLNEEFYYDEQSWGKYLYYEIPSIDAISRQRTSSVNSNVPTPNSINKILSGGLGISETSPIFIEFSMVVSREEILGNTYYYMSDMFTKSISKIPEYMELAANLQQATDGDYFEIFGSYGGSNESMDDFVDEITSKGRKIRIDYEISLFEENILMSTQTYSVSENFTKKIWYRPILSFTNTTASLDVTMKVIDLIDNSQIDRFASLSLTKDIFKYGKKLTRINLDNAWKPKIYNFKNSNSLNSGSGFDSLNVGDINLNTVNYPVISDRIEILVGTSPSVNSSYKGMGLAQMILNPFGNVIKFNIAEKIDANGNVTPYDLTKVTQNSTITLSFKSDIDFFEKDMWQETDQNDFKNGIVVFKIEQQDLKKIKKITNNNFYLTIRSDKTGVRSLLYSGKWLNFEDLKFLDKSSETTGSDLTNLGDFKDLSLTPADLEKILNSANGANNAGSANLTNNPNSNLLVFLSADANLKKFDDYLAALKVSIFLRKPGGNSKCLTYLYFLLNVSPAVIADIKLQNGVVEAIPIPFCIGADTTGTNTVNLDDIKNKVVGFNCAAATKTSSKFNI